MFTPTSEGFGVPLYFYLLRWAVSIYCAVNLLKCFVFCWAFLMQLYIKSWGKLKDAKYRHLFWPGRVKKKKNHIKPQPVTCFNACSIKDPVLRHRVMKHWTNDTLTPTPSAFWDGEVVALWSATNPVPSVWPPPFFQNPTSPSHPPVLTWPFCDLPFVNIPDTSVPAPSSPTARLNSVFISS